MVEQTDILGQWLQSKPHEFNNLAFEIVPLKSLQFLENFLVPEF